MRMAAHRDDLFDGEGELHLDVLRDETDGASEVPARPAIHFHIIQPAGTEVARQEAGENLQERGLARAVRAYDGDCFARVQIQGHVPQDGAFAIAHPHAAQRVNCFAFGRDAPGFMGVRSKGSHRIASLWFTALPRDE